MVTSTIVAISYLRILSICFQIAEFQLDQENTTWRRRGWWIIWWV